MDTINPATGEVWAQVPRSGPADADAAVAAARAAFPAWSATPPEARGEHLKKVAAIFLEHGDELAQLETTDDGVPLGITRYACGSVTAALWERKAHETLEASTGRTVQLDAKTLGLTLREPYGVIAAIVPFNMPLAMLSNKVGGALAAGNTVVVKPPEQASVACLRLASWSTRSCRRARVNIVSGLGQDVGDAMVRHPEVGQGDDDRVVGHRQGDPAGRRRHPHPRHVRARRQVAEHRARRRRPRRRGDRHHAHVGVHVQRRPGLRRRLADPRAAPDRSRRCSTGIEDIAKATVIGDPIDPATTMGPLISPGRSSTRSSHYIEIGKKEAELLFGGRHGAELVPDRPGGYWVEPTLFLAEDNSISICQEEIFGPVAVVIPFDTDDEAIAIANDSRYGLASGVWSRDLARVHRYIRDIQSGNVWVNTYLQTRYELPFAGIKDSGYGHDEVADFSREKAAVIAIPRDADDGPGTNTVFGTPL